MSAICFGLEGRTPRDVSGRTGIACRRGGGIRLIGEVSFPAAWLLVPVSCRRSTRRLLIVTDKPEKLISYLVRPNVNKRRLLLYATGYTLKDLLF